ncbi:MAG: galactitol-1-phosphate 5-dehydrogenase [Oscillospiraceae bacterium]|nr:galactitol-1-phosphate 5-dehydrogenase [Oscillospiraceae bacterium]
MKAVRMYAPKDLRVEEIPVPRIKSGEVLVKVAAVGVCGSDIPRANIYGAHVSPITLGHEFSGEIIEVGNQVRGFAVGDHVTVPPLIPCHSCLWCEKGAYSLCDNYDYYGSRSDGAMAEYIAVKSSNLIQLPKSISFEDAATTDPAANALHSMAVAKFTPDDTVCICGAGPIGLFALQYAKIKGAKKIIAADILEEKLDIARLLGADVVINSAREDMAEAVKNETDGYGASIVIDFSGIPAAQAACIRSASKLGRVILLGISHKSLSLSDYEVDLIMRSELEIKGSWNSFTHPFPGNDWTEAVELFEKHGMSAKNIITHRLPLEDAPKTLLSMAEPGACFGKVMFFPNIPDMENK